MTSFQETTFLAPGKLVLAGEYAVIDGASALVMAIDRGVGCVKSEGSGISTPSGDVRFVFPAIKDLLQSHHFQFFDWNPVTQIPSNKKPGFGGSAAACVASCAAAEISLNTAYEIHKSVQGSGSGIDIAAAIHGGVIRFKQTKLLPQIERVDLLKDHTPIIIWSGEAAKTGPRVEQYLSWNKRSAFVHQTEKLTEQFLDDPICTIRQLHKLLCAMAKEAGIQYMTQKMLDIVNIAEGLGGAAKASGAGGGDCMIACIPPSKQNEFIRKLQESGHNHIRYNIANGVRELTKNMPPTETSIL